MKNLRFKKLAPVAVIALLLLTSCTAGNEQFVESSANFWAGLWHGFISLFAFIVSLFNENVNVYEVNNTGWPYNLGFIFGCMMFYGGGSKSTCKKRGN
jgi:membrane protein YdbS with pleckstrin-like domain